MDYDQKGPAKFKGTGAFHTTDALFDTCTTWDVQIELAGGLPMHFMSDNHAQPIVKTYRDKWQADRTTFFGSKGWISLIRGAAYASNPEWLRMKQSEGDRRVVHHKNYYQAFENSVRSDALSHLSLLAIKSGSEVVWDPAAYRIQSPEALNAAMSHEIRAPWKQS
ncbi:MAG: hypothetical protein EHM17_01845 [Verrucomicrobiaceae bacterium]|nr:MAG: hypothetical protein EHM17_01845 [Verrucomicrobiaceae bacterium]